MRVLVTTSRMPFAVDQIRKLGRQGHTTFAADTFRTAPGNHSSYVEKSFVVPPPRQQPRDFVRDIARIAREHTIDVIVPTFEEVFFLSRYRDELPAHTQLFAPGFDVLTRLHNKGTFLELVAELDLPTPSSRIVTDRDQLRAAIGEHAEYFARPVYSRGGLALLSNAGPFAGALSVEDCDPTEAAPWVVQPYLSGREICSQSIARDGVVVAHCTYWHPASIRSGGVAFESIDVPFTLHAAQRLAAATNYTGQFSLDFLDHAGRPVVSECNPRSTAGVTLMTSEQYSDAIFGPAAQPPQVTEPGHRSKIKFGLLISMLEDWRHAPESLAMLFDGASEIYSAPGDRWPALFQVLSYTHVLGYQLELGEAAGDLTDIVRAQFYDVCYDGEPLAA